MLFSKLFASIWHYFDVICYVLGLICIVCFAFYFGTKWGTFAIGIALFLTGYLSELVASKGGDN